jgi:diguanylate cyclase (GGDEF)-like protein
MMRLTKSALFVGIPVHILWRLLAPAATSDRDFLLYNSLWILALIITIAAPLSLDRVVVGAISLAILSWGVGSIAAGVDQASLSAPRFIELTQLCYTLFYPLILIAIPRISTTSSKLKPIELLDSLIVGVGLTSIISIILISTAFSEGALLTSSDFFIIFYPVGDLALLLISILQLITRGVDRQSGTFFAGVLIFAISDINYLWLFLNNRYTYGNFADNGWLVAIALFAIAASLGGTTQKSIKPIHPSLVAISIFISPILLAISALHPNLFPRYILIPAIANLILGFIRMSTALRAAQKLVDERTLARTDELTGLANRRRLLAEINEFSEVEGALLLLDLNGFKPVNDQHGHEVGDIILREVARRFTRAIPADALLARLGGDEFGVLVKGGYEETLDIAYALRASLSYPFTIKGSSISVGVSIGHVQNDGAGALLKRADEAMYRAKSSDMGVAQS